jgi:hypothetical protein
MYLRKRLNQESDRIWKLNDYEIWTHSDYLAYALIAISRIWSQRRCLNATQLEACLQADV